MQTLRRNKRHMYYSLLIGSQPEYLLDKDGNRVIDFVSSDGTIHYKKTGRKELIYSEPQGFMGNISLSGGEIRDAEYGVDLSNYDAILVMGLNEIPITETSLVWFETEPRYKDTAKTIVDGSSADYKVLQVKPSLQYSKFILGKLANQ